MREVPEAQKPRTIAINARQDHRSREDRACAAGRVRPASRTERPFWAPSRAPFRFQARALSTDASAARRSTSSSVVSNDVTSLTSVSPFAARSAAARTAWSNRGSARPPRAISRSAHPARRRKLHWPASARRGARPAVRQAPVAQPPRRCVGPRREIEPKPVLEIGLHLRAEQPALRQRMAAALAQIGEGFRARFDRRKSPPRRRARRSWSRRKTARRRRRASVISAGEQPSDDERIGEARAVHVHGDARRMGESRRARRSRRASRPSRPRSTCESDSAPGCADLTRPRGKRASVSLSAVGRDLAAVAGNADELRAAGEKFRRAAFVVVDMRLFVAEHRLPRTGQRRQRERVGGRAGRRRERRRLGLENLGELRARRAREHRRRRRPARDAAARGARSRRGFPARRPRRCRSRNSRLRLLYGAGCMHGARARLASRPSRARKLRGEKYPSRARRACAQRAISGMCQRNRTVLLTHYRGRLAASLGTAPSDQGRTRCRTQRQNGSKQTPRLMRIGRATAAVLPIDIELDHPKIRSERGLALRSPREWRDERQTEPTPTSRRSARRGPR